MLLVDTVLDVYDGAVNLACLGFLVVTKYWKTLRNLQSCSLLNIISWSILISLLKFSSVEGTFLYDGSLRTPKLASLAITLAGKNVQKERNRLKRKKNIKLETGFSDFS